MEKIQIKNIRSLKNTGEIPLTPITLLVGGNSSGKSTFLRIFPLIKQSIRKRTDGPLLWAGDVDDYVDFGSLKDTITNNDTSEEISFSFNFNLIFNPRVRSRVIVNPNNGLVSNSLGNSLPINYLISIKQLGESDVQAYISRVDIKIYHSKFSFLFSPNPHDLKIIVDGETVELEKENKEIIYPIIQYVHHSIFGFTLPSIHLLISELCDELFQKKEETDVPFGFFDDSPRNVLSILGGYLCYGLSLSVIERKKVNIHHSRDKIIKVINRLKSFDGDKKKEYISKLKLIYFYRCFPAIDDYLNSYFRKVHYIAPLRATAERYYRLRNLSIDEVDYQGKNLSVFLDGLNRKKRILKFNTWTDRLFGFHVRTKNETGHLSMQISLQGDSKSVNLSDTGFGFSQILPIITQLWDLSTRPGNNIPTLVAIEQPELHLHPSLQADLVDAFIDSIVLHKKNTLQLLMETHSETIINCFGRAIAEKKIGKEQVSVIVFNKDQTNGLTKIQCSNFDEDGYLNNWPIGFFSSRR